MPQSTSVTPGDILSFWFDAGPAKWWVRDSEFDGEIRIKFGQVHDEARHGLLDHWTKEPPGALALTIVLDQFSRNIFRQDRRAYAQDELARAIARQAIDRGFEQAFPVKQRNIFFLPFMHDENIASQNFCVALYQVSGDADGEIHAREHADIICRFGRFPHRNDLLGRLTSPAEHAFLQAGGFSG